MVSSWIRSMFSSKKKNKKPVSLLRPRLFKDLELVLLEDRITPAYTNNFDPITGILSIGVVQNTAGDLYQSQTVIYTTPGVLNVQLLSFATSPTGGVFFPMSNHYFAPGSTDITGGFLYS
jgi:hypothetical protein